jgi:hypothetical protein
LALALEWVDIWSYPDMRRDGFFDWFGFKSCRIVA